MRKKIPTFAELREMFAESSARHDREIQEIREIQRENFLGFKELRESQKETDRIVKETSLQMKKSDEKLEKIGIKMGGIDENQGFHAEQFFQDVFEKKLEFGGIKYDEMIPNLKHKDRDGEIEFDIALLNGKSIALIEVKNRIHPKFVIELAEDRVKKFREYFPKYKNFETYLGIAGFSFSEEVLHRASAYGIGIIKQVGDGVEISADNLRAY